MTVKLKEQPTNEHQADELSFNHLLALSSGQVKCPQKKFTFHTIVSHSPLYRFALQGLDVFLKQEGREKLDEIIGKGINLDIYHLVNNSYSSTLIETVD